MKLVLIGDYPIKNSYGGVNEHIKLLASALTIFNDLDISIITLYDRDLTISEDNLKIYTVKRNIHLPRVLTIISDALHMKKKIEEIKPDIVHIQGSHYPYGFLAAILKEKYLLVLTLHALAEIEINYNSFLNKVSALATLIPEKYILSKIKHIIVCSEDMRRRIIKYVKASIYVIPNGIDNSIENITISSISNIIKHPAILYIGRFEKIKGVDLLIKAIPEIKRNIPGVHVYLAGNGSKKNMMKKLARRLNIDNCIIYLGYITGQEKYTCIKAADLILVPSYYESFGLALLEAMACGKPVVATRVGNIPYLVEDGISGYLVEPGNYRELATRSIEILSNNTLGEKMGMSGKMKAQGYTWDNVAKLTYELYNEILQ
jgi:glycosyltransferase involved in cell wall biosynthesis